MINVMFLMNGAKPPRGGEFLSLYLITHLRKDLFYPVLVYAEEGIIVKKIKDSGIESARVPLNNKITNIYPRETRLYSPFFIFSFIWNLFSSGGIFKLMRIIKRRNIHLIYCTDNLSKLIGGIAGKLTGVKVVAPCHDDFKEDALGKTMRLFYFLLIDRILTVSEKVKLFFKIRGRVSSNVRTVFNGIDTVIFDPDKVDNSMKTALGLEDNAIVIGSIGVLEPDKGQRYLFEAIKKLKSEGISNIVCLVCGDGPEEKNLKMFVRKSGLDNQVLFLGLRNDIPKILRILDICVITSLTIESFSMVAVESMGMKIPVIATNVGGLPEVVEDGKTGILVPPGTVDVLSKAIKYLIENPKLRIAMGENGRKRVLEKFTIEENVKKIEKVFLDLLGVI